MGIVRPALIIWLLIIRRRVSIAIYATVIFPGALLVAHTLALAVTVTITITLAITLALAMTTPKAGYVALLLLLLLLSSLLGLLLLLMVFLMASLSRGA
jgi:hypothetical protein